ncbi:MAG TPA: sensor histidine kinase [Chloroflexota bacterium]|nr:sensor histidine kinase [Chloroflexota bacterium]
MMPGTPSSPTTLPPPLIEEHLAARRILAVTEEELQRIVLDIHDGLAQRLFIAQTQLSLIKQKRRYGQEISEAEWDENLHRLSHLLDEALQEIRHFLGSFRSPDFAQRDMADIIHSLVTQHELLTGCRVTLRCGNQPMPASLPVKIALYRICQEALTNAYRHAHTAEQTVSLTLDKNMIRLEVSDPGQGFTPPPLHGPEATEQAEHIGLRGMRDRVGLINGQFELDTAPGRGTRIIVKVPFDG